MIMFTAMARLSALMAVSSMVLLAVSASAQADPMRKHVSCSFGMQQQRQISHPARISLHSLLEVPFPVDFDGLEAIVSREAACLICARRLEQVAGRTMVVECKRPYIRPSVPSALHTCFKSV